MYTASKATKPVCCWQQKLLVSATFGPQQYQDTSISATDCVGGHTTFHEWARFFFIDKLFGHS